MKKSDITKIDPFTPYTEGKILGLTKFITKPKRICFAKLSHKLIAFGIDVGLLLALLLLGHVPYFLWPFVALGYFTSMECSRLHGSIGEYAVGIEVIHRSGKEASWRHILARNLTYLATLGLSSLSMLLSRKARGLHDQIAHTVTVETTP